jgi:hypothetical protein
MPQLDLFSILNQLYWGSFFFAVFYYLITIFFIPAFFTSLYARKAFTESRSEEIYHLVGTLFFAHAVVNLFFESLFDNFASFFEHVIYARAVSAGVYETSFALEFHKLYEPVLLD